MSKVPELNYMKFLQLLGIELNPAEPAQAEITFPVKPDHPEPFVIVPARTQVTAEAPDGGPPLVFETERALTALTASLASVQAFDGYAFTDVTRENQEATQGFQPFGPLANDDSALLLGFAYDDSSLLVEFPQVEVNLAVWVLPDSAAIGVPPVRLAGHSLLRPGSHPLGILERRRLAEPEPAQRRDPRLDALPATCI